ncbi:MAG: hypothetical protein IKH88_02120 [Prevotella sp.]|nr:hypothetical protein [Prevotella sp.]
MTKKLFLLLLTVIASINVATAQAPYVPQDDSLMVVVMNEKVVIPIGEHGSLPKSPSPCLYIYMYGNNLDFGTNLAGCPVRLVQDDEVVFSSLVETDGTVMLPTGLSGLYELQITVDDVIYSAYFLFNDD